MLLVLFVALYCVINNASAMNNSSTNENMYIINASSWEFYFGNVSCDPNQDCTIYCNEQNSCRGANIYCPQNHSCNIHCNITTHGAHVYPRSPCEDATIYCPDNGQCDVRCAGDTKGDHSCSNAQFHWPYNTTYSLTCSGGDVCSNIIITAPDDYNDFTFHCDGYGACSSSIIHCPKYADCNIFCNGIGSCPATINWPINGTGEIHCSSHRGSCGVNFPLNSNVKDMKLVCNETYQCSFAFIDCPQNANCDISCGADYACYYARFKWINDRVNIGTISCHGNHSCFHIEFPIPPSNKDFVMDCNDEYQCSESIIYCPENADCHIICSADHSCEETIIIWSMNQGVNSTLTCINQDACIDTVKPPIYAPDDDTEFQLLCEEEYQCFGAVIVCPIRAECHIKCYAEFSCQNAIFIWPEQHAYSLKCNSIDHACSNIEYTPYDQYKQLTFECDASHMCQGSVINCPSFADCSIMCNGADSCMDLVVNCAKNQQCTVICSDSYGTCNRIDINGEATLSCSDGNNACDEVKFPIPPPNIDYNLNCADQYQCAESIIYCPENSNCHVTCKQLTCNDAFIVWPTNNWVNSTLTCIAPSNTIGFHCDNVNPPPWDVYYRNESDEYHLCNGDTKCAGAIIHCPSDIPCNIRCDGKYSCNGAIFKWPENQSYSLYCAPEEGSCKGVTITPYDNNKDFVLKCTEGNMCRQSIINCPLNASCAIVCSGIDSCFQATINGGVNNSLTVTCIYAKSCYDAFIYAQNTSLFILNGSEVYSQEYISIWFPSIDDNGDPRAIIDGADNFALDYVDFYAYNGWKDIKIINYVSKYIYHHGIMHCGNNYNQKCYFLYNKFECIPYANVTCNSDKSNIIQTTSYPTTTQLQTSLATTQKEIDYSTSFIHYTTQSVKIEIDNKNGFSLNLLWLSLIIIIGSAICCLILVCVYKKIKLKQQQQITSKHIQLNSLIEI